MPFLQWLKCHENQRLFSKKCTQHLVSMLLNLEIIYFSKKNWKRWRMRVSGDTHPMGGVAPRPLFRPRFRRLVDKDAVGFQILRSKIPREASDFWIPPCWSPLPRITRKRRPAARKLESAIAVVVVVVFFFAIAIKFPEALRSWTRSWKRSGRRSSKLPPPSLSLSLSHTHTPCPYHMIPFYCRGG